MTASSDSTHGNDVSATARRLRVDAATAEVGLALRSAGVCFRLLKGPALTDWYGGSQSRAYMDADLWVPPGDLEAAGRVMSELGFVSEPHDKAMPDWWQAHAVGWSRDSDQVVVDLHRKLQGVGADAATTWAVLASEPAVIDVAGAHIEILAPAPRALYVTLHAAHHGQQSIKARDHVAAAVAVLGDGTWRQVADLAERVTATDMFVTGLRLVPDGAALADRLGLGHTSTVRSALHASTPPPVALGFEQLASARGLGRARILLAKLVPPPAYIRYWWPAAARSRRMLIAGYLYRPVWLLRSAPEGFRAWRRARRQVRGG